MARKTAMAIILVMMVSCGITSHQNFTTYNKEPFNDGSLTIKLDGIYFIDPYKNYRHSPPIFFYLFPDGSLVQEDAEGSSYILDEKFWNDPENYLNNLRLPKFGSPGHYYVRDSTITMQYFEINPGNFKSTNSLELVGKIKNDSTIVILKGNCKWCAGSWLGYNRDGTMNFDSLEYSFYKTDIIPDTSVIWFRKKKWYQKEVWYNK